MSETGQLGQIGHRWAALKKEPFFMILVLDKTSSYFIEKSLLELTSSRKLKIMAFQDL